LEVADWICVAQDRDQLLACINIKIKLLVAWHMPEKLSATQEVIWCVRLDNFVCKLFSHLEIFIIEYKEDVSLYEIILNRKYPIENYEQNT
jgi:hypothetical protein